ncbi:MAG: arylesterase [Pseudomonadota bacterium]
MQENFLKWVGKWNQVIGAVVLGGFVAAVTMPTAAQPVPTNENASNTSAGTRNHSASKTVLVLGDSLSAEYGLARGAGWVPLLEKRLRAEGIDAAIENASISGETTSGGKARLAALLQQHKPDILILELGGNDGLRGLPMSATSGNLRDMINMAKKTGARVLLLGMQIPPNYGADYTRQFAALYPRVAKETGAVLVPFFLEGLQTRVDLFQSDRIHPTAAAQPLMLENVWPMLRPMLKSEAGSAQTPTGRVTAPAR